MIPKSIYSNWDRAITRVLSGSAAADTEDEADMYLSKAEFLNKAAHPAHQPPSIMTGKGKAPAQLVTVLELSTDSESDNSNIWIIGTIANPAPQVSLIATAKDKVTPSQSSIPRSIVHTPTVLPASESDNFFFMNLVARELAGTGKFTETTKQARRGTLGNPSKGKVTSQSDC